MFKQNELFTHTRLIKKFCVYMEGWSQCEIVIGVPLYWLVGD